MKISQLLKDKAQIRIDLGETPYKGFTSLSEVGSHYSKVPWKLPDESVDILRADHILEKVSRENNGFIKWMDEAWRVMKYDGQLMIASSYGMSYGFIQDPRNVNPLNETSYTYFDPLEPIAGIRNYKIYKPKPWKITHISWGTDLMEALLVKRRIDSSYEKA